MRWPRLNRKSRVQSDTDIFRPSTTTTTTTTTNGDATLDVSHDDLSLKAPYSTSPGLSRMFTDAALYERVLNAGPEALKSCLVLGSEEQASPVCVGSFNELIGRDLGDNERLVTGRLAKLSVNNWATSTDDPFGVDALGEEDQEEVSPLDGAQQEEKRPTLSTPPTLQEEQVEEAKLTPEEIVDLLEQEFGALAPPGEEKLLLETDAAFFKDVVILVGLATPSYTHP
jgi:sterol 3beta-glucosyltransferase